jgi:hypothetical protein
MPSANYQKYKKTIYEWRDNNQDAYRAYVKVYNDQYNKEHREAINRKTLGNYYYKKQCQIFRNILLADL